MRQPASVYVRAARKTAARFLNKVRRRVRKAISPKAVQNSKPQREARPLVDAASLNAALDALGLTRGDVVMVHSGISHLGKIAGGPRTVFELIRERIGDEGHVLYPVFPFDTLMYHYLKTRPTFDVRTAPTKMGALTEYALKSSGGLRSVHPSHSVLAFGPHRAEFVNKHHLCPAPFTDQSPFARLVDVQGKILLLGVGLNSTTSFHRTEDRLGERFPVKVYHSEAFQVACVDDKGMSCNVDTRAHDPFVSRIRDCNLVRAAFLGAGVLREVPVGSGVVGMIDAAAMDRFLEELCFGPRLTIYGKLWG
jgi:aminoglycoside 3-N-acetyltransferase